MSGPGLKPARPTKARLLLVQLSRGWMTALDALQAVGLMTLPQRVHDFREAGILIDDQWHRPDGRGPTAVKQYRLAMPLDDALRLWDERSTTAVDVEPVPPSGPAAASGGVA